jgi:hypothetical protein
MRRSVIALMGAYMGAVALTTRGSSCDYEIQKMPELTPEYIPTRTKFRKKPTYSLAELKAYKAQRKKNKLARKARRKNK